LTYIQHKQIKYTMYELTGQQNWRWTDRPAILAMRKQAS